MCKITIPSIKTRRIKNIGTNAGLIAFMLSKVFPKSEPIAPSPEPAIPDDGTISLPYFI